MSFIIIFKMEINPIDKRILRLVDLLKFKEKISSKEEFCNKIEITRATFSKIKNGYPNHFTVKQIDIICNEYHVNANWIFGLEEEVFLSENAQKLLK